jgi:Big-like domain-containing protein/VCBS repeat protein
VNGTFPSSEMLQSPDLGTPVHATAADLDHDGNDEIVLVYDPNARPLYSLAVYHRGASAFQPGVNVNTSVPAEVGHVYAADLNKDGAAEVFTLDSLKHVLVFVNDGTGTLAAPVTYTLQQQPLAAVVTDINQDGNPDLAFATINGSSGTPTMFGNGDGTLQEAVLHPMTGMSQMYSIGAGDINGDGRTDFLLADSDLNLVHVLRAFCPSKATTTAITQSKDSTLYNEYVTFTVTVTPDDGGNLTGRALIFDGLRYIGPLPLDPATRSASLYAQSLGPGDHTIIARYEGNEDYMESTASLSHNVYRMPFGAPQFFSALGGGGTAGLTWVATDDSASFEIWRMTAGTWAVLGTTTNQSFTDDTVTNGQSYFYRIRAVRTGDPSTLSAFTPADAASIRSWAPPSMGGLIQHIHIEDARLAVNMVRAAANLPAFSFTDPSLQNVVIQAIHITQMRTAISEALAAAGATIPSFDPITPQVTVVRFHDVYQILGLAN